MSRSVELQGTLVPGFEAVGEAFLANFEEGLETGASCAAYVDGEEVVNIWGGVADAVTGRPWDDRTLAMVYSTSKGIVAICANLLIQQGKLDVDRPVADYWPEFAANGKGDIPVRMLLNHQAGLPVIDRVLTLEEVLEVTPIADALAAQKPVWVPGTTHGYHALTYGWLVGEVVRRVTGKSIGRFLAEEIAAPLGLDMWIGLPDSEYDRVASFVTPPPTDPRTVEGLDPEVRELAVAQAATFADPSSLAVRALTLEGALVPRTPPGERDPDGEKRMYASEMPSVNGITNARSVARLYAACIGDVDGVRVLDDATVKRATVEESAGIDEVLRWPNRIGLGFWLSTKMNPMLGPAAFGHAGAGGSLGCADPDRGIGFGYVMNQMNGSGMLPDKRRYRIIDALNRSLS